MKILLTGFEPFGKSPLNPSQKLLDALPDLMFQKVHLIKMILPVDQIEGPRAMLTHICEHRPDAILSFGLAYGRPKISLERLAVNLKDFRIPDNRGTTITDQPVAASGPAAYFSTLPIRSMFAALQDEGIPVEISLSAGAYLCNQVFYTMMHEITSHHLPIKAGFIHLPALPHQAAESDKPIPSLNLDLEIKAAKILISQLVK